MATDKILGIDLGTTNTVFSVLEGGEPEVILNSEQKATTPSVVGFNDDRDRLVGQSALNQAVDNPDKTERSIKRYMGRSDYTFNVSFDEFSPEEVSGMILRKVRNDAEEYIGEAIEKAVITVPAYFNDRQRQATKNAGHVAGLEVERIINEPTAAAIAYGMDRDQSQKVLVADLGGGTFDVSILDLGSGVFEVIATDGIRHLGGDDWDIAIVDHLIDQFKQTHGINLRGDPQAKERLKRSAEQAKIDLSKQMKTNINIPFIATTDEGPAHLETTLSREQFDQMTIELRKQLKDPIESTIDAANIRTRDISSVILVGGSTRMPQIQREIESITGRQPKADIDPDEVVAKGAAIQGGIISGEQEDMILLDVTPKSLGIEVKGGVFEPLIPKNTTIPTSISRVYTTAEENQETVEINVYQGENQIANQNELLGDFILGGIPKAQAGTPEIQVKFRINANGMVRVNAIEKSKGSEKEVTIDRETGLTEKEVADMEAKAQEYEEITLDEKETLAIRNEADRLVAYGEQLLIEADKDLTPEQAIHIEQKIEDINDILADEDAPTEKLKRETRRLRSLVGDDAPTNKDGEDDTKYPTVAVQSNNAH